MSAEHEAKEQAAIDQVVKVLSALEADLFAAESCMVAAEERFKFHLKQANIESAEPAPKVEEATAPAAGIPEEDAIVEGHADKEASEMHHKGAKNAGALSDKAVSRERWLAKRSQEKRFKEATKRSRDRLRHAQRDRRADFGQDAEIVAAEKEFSAAQDRLEQAVVKAEEMAMPDEDIEAMLAWAEHKMAAMTREVQVDEDYAAQVEADYQDHRESRGAKNTSTMSDKELSCKKWEAARDKESREREQHDKTRDVGRSEARDRKMDAAAVDE